MANTTYRAACERVLRLSGRNPFADNTEFNSGTIDAEKAALKEFFNIANQRYGRTQRGRSLAREFYLDTADGTNAYSIDSKTTVDRLVPDSWYISTSGKGAPVKFYPGGYYQYKRDYPENDESENQPKFWYYLPATDAAPERVAFSPPPDGIYRVNYSGYLAPVPLSDADDELIFPPTFEDGLILAALSFLQMHQAEGKSPDIEKLLEPIFSEIEQNNLGPVDEVHSVNLRFEIDSYGIY